MKNYVQILKKVGRILSKHQKHRVFQLMIIMVLGGFMEMLSVSLILPFMEVVMNPEKLMANELIEKICLIFQIYSSQSLLMLMSVVLAIIYILKNIYLMLQMTIQNRFTLRNMLNMQQRLLHGILIRPYEFFLEVNSGEIMRVLNDDVVGAFNLLSSLLSLFSELIVSFFLVATVFVISPGVTISIAGVFAIMLLIVMFFVRPILNRASIAQQKARAKTNLWILQAVQGIKELKITHSEGFFEGNYKTNGDIYVKSMFTYQILSVLPRFLIEAVAMSAMFFVIAFMIGGGAELNEIIPILSGVAMAAIRLLPAINRISSYTSSIAYSEPMIDKLLEHIDGSNYYEKTYKESNGTVQNDINLKTKIEFDKVTFKYPTGNKKILDDACFRIEKNQSVGIVGASGAGKSTAVDILLGLLKPQSGGVLIDGVDIQSGIDSWTGHIGYIPQAIFLLDGNVRDNVAFGLKKGEIRDENVWSALRDAALEDFVKSLPDGLDTELGERGLRLSGGQRQRIGIARAIYNNPDILVFDEATSALDNDTEAAIMESISNLYGNKTIIIIAHRLTTIRNCDVIYRVEDGRIIKERT